MMLFIHNFQVKVYSILREICPPNLYLSDESKYIEPKIVSYTLCYILSIQKLYVYSRKLIRITDSVLLKEPSTMDCLCEILKIYLDLFIHFSVGLSCGYLDFVSIFIESIKMKRKKIRSRFMYLRSTKLAILYLFCSTV